MKGSIGENLKKCRVDAKKSVKEISDLLKSKGFKASEKTIYSWESGNSQPSPDAFLIMDTLILQHTKKISFLMIIVIL